MATPTYVALDTVVIGTATPSITFSSISQNYNNLVIIAQAGYTSTNVGQGFGIRFNNDSSSVYSATILEGDGSSRSSYRGSNATSASCGAIANGSQTNFGSTIIEINNYRNTDTYKNFLFRNSGPTYVQTGVGYWRPAGASNISSITILTQGTAGNLAVGSTFTLYGIVAEGQSPAAKATGGVITSDANYYYHTFYSSGIFTPTQSLTCDALVVAGGGGGGGGLGGGGGAGGFRTATGLSVTATNYAVTVGAGGAAGNPSTLVTGSIGANSVFSTITSSGGGGGAGSNPGNPTTGGSGGGGTYNKTAGAAGNAGGYTPVEGYAGGTGFAANPNFGGGGGGGASAIGGTYVVGVGAGVGGAGVTSSFSGTSVTYAGGGGGAFQMGTGAGGLGGAGGGGNGGNSNSSGTETQVATSGTSNTGGGGGSGYTAGNGGSGIVIVRYLKA